MDIETAPSTDGGEPSARFAEVVRAAARPVIGFGPPPVADPRAELAGLIERRASLRAEAATKMAAVGRLEPLIAEPTTAAAALAAFEAEEAEIVRRWASEATDEPPPAPRAERRAELAEALKVAEQRANAARVARQAAEAEVTNLNGRLGPHEAAIAAAALSVLAAESDPILARLRANIMQLETDLSDISAVCRVALDEADRAKQARSPSAAAMSATALRIVDAAGFASDLMRMVGLPPAAHAKWATFVADLKEETDHAE